MSTSDVKADPASLKVGDRWQDGIGDLEVAEMREGILRLRAAPGMADHLHIGGNGSLARLRKEDDAK